MTLDARIFGIQEWGRLVTRLDTKGLYACISEICGSGEKMILDLKSDAKDTLIFLKIQSFSVSLWRKNPKYYKNILRVDKGSLNN